jgi:hypothetical protein
MNDEDLFIFLTQILEKLDSIDVQLKRLNYKQEHCEPPAPEVYYPPEPEYYPLDVYCEPEVYCPPEPVCVYDPPIYCEPVCAVDYSYIYNPYYDYTLDYLVDYLVPLDEYCYDECYYYYC